MTTTRRSTLLAFPAAALFLASSPSNANADGKTMSDDEALCKFGSPSKKVGDACVRAGLSTKRKTGVDAYGNVDRELIYMHSVVVVIAVSEKVFHETQNRKVKNYCGSLSSNDCSPFAAFLSFFLSFLGGNFVKCKPKYVDDPNNKGQLKNVWDCQ